MTYTVKSVTNNQYSVKVVNQNGSLTQAPATVPTVTSTSISDLSAYATSAAMLANDATTYANAVTYVNGRFFVNTSQLTANLANYQTTAGLSASVLTLTANNANNLGGIAAASYVNTSQLSSNLSNYQTTAGLSANVATLTANNTNNLGGGAAASYVNTAQLSSNLSNYQTAAGLSANVATLTANNANNLGGIAAASYVNTSQLSSNLNNYQTTAGLSANVATLTTNNSTNFGGLSLATVQSQITGNAATAYANATTFSSNATNITSGTLPDARLSSAIVNTSGSFTVTGMLTFSNGATFSNTITANGSNGSAGQVLTSSGASGNVYWSTAAAGGFANGQSISVNNFALAGGFTANNSNGSAGQILISNGAGVYWGAAPAGGDGTVTNIATGSGLTGGPITTTGTVSVLANTGVIANTTGLFVNSSYIATLTANNTNNLGGIAASSYVNTSQLSSNLSNYQTTAGLSANVATLTSNNSTNFDGLSLTTVQSQITGNASTAYTNAVNYVTAQSFVNTSQLSSNLSSYQTTAGLAANVLILTANAAGFLGNSSGTISNITSWITGNSSTAYTNAITIASNATNLTTGALPDARLSSAVVNTSGAFTLGGITTFNANVVISNTGELVFAANAGIFANGSLGSAGQVLASNGSTVYWSTTPVTASSTDTLTNKRINPRVSSTASASSVTPDISSFDVYIYTALAAGLTINATTGGSPVNGSKLTFRFKDNGTARGLTWTTSGTNSFRAIGVTLPTTTTISKITYVGCIYNSDESFWDVVAVTTQA